MKHHHQETDNTRWVATLRCGIKHFTGCQFAICDYNMVPAIH